MPSEIKPYCPSHDHYTDKIPAWPNSKEITEELDGVKIVVFCDAYDTHGYALLKNEGIHQVRAFLHKNKDDQVGIEQDVSKLMYFHGNSWLRIISSGDISEIHLRHESIGDTRKFAVSLEQLQPDY